MKRSLLVHRSGDTVGSFVSRLQMLTDLSEEDAVRAARCLGPSRTVLPRHELVVEGERLHAPRVLLDGWGCRIKLLSDGRRQIVGMLLPGEVIGFCHRPLPTAVTTVIAATRVTLAELPPLRTLRTDQAHTTLRDALEISATLDEIYFVNHITRLGRHTAYERMAHFFLEMRDRLRLSGQCRGERFAMPLTQEMLGDTLGLTAVHVNRTLQQLRRDGMLDLQQGELLLHAPDELVQLADYVPLDYPA